MSTIKQLAIRAGLIGSESSDREGLANFDYRHFARLVALDCLRLSEEEIRLKYDIVPYNEKEGLDRAADELAKVIDAEILANIRAGAAVVDDFGGYEESTHEKQAEFARKRNYPI